MFTAQRRQDASLYTSMDLEARVDTLFDETHETSEQEEVDLLAGIEALHYEISTLQYVKDYVQQHNAIPENVVQLMHQQDPDVVNHFPNLFNAVQANEEIDALAITEEIDDALETLRGASYKAIVGVLKLTKKATVKLVSTVASFATTIAIISGILYALGKATAHADRNKIPTYNEMSKILDTLKSGTDAIITFGQDVINKKLYERQDGVGKHAEKVLRKHGDILKIEMDTKNKIRVSSEVGPYTTTRDTTLEDAGYDEKAFRDIQRKIKEISSHIDTKSDKIDALISKMDQMSKNVYENEDIPNDQKMNIYATAEIINIYVSAIDETLSDTNTYIKRMAKMAKKDASS